MENIIIAAILTGGVSSACYYIRKQLKKGAGCIGCPASGSCSCCCSKKHTDV